MADFANSFAQAVNPNAAFYAAVVGGSLCVAHLGMAAYIARKDLSGAWDQYSLKRTKNTASTYLMHLPKLLFDLVFLLFPALYAFGLYYDEALFTPLWREGDSASVIVAALAKMTVLAVVGNLLNRTYAMLIHRWFHSSPGVYQFIHKRHHCGQKDMCATSAWEDSTTEFILMEVLGVFILTPLVFPFLCTHWTFHCLAAAANGAGAAIDHCGFHVPDTMFDARYHFVHHRDLVFNFAEIEGLDILFGTWRQYKDERSAREKPFVSSAVK